MSSVRLRVTEEEFMALPPDGSKHELVGGEVTTVPTNFEHDAIGANLVALLAPTARGKGFLAISQAGFRMRSGQIRCPDVSFTLRERVPGGRPPRVFGDAAPDFCIEILSPSELPSYAAARLQDYFESGAEVVWHVLPEEREVHVYSAPTLHIICRGSDLLNLLGLLPGFQCTVNDVFDLG